MAYRCNPCRHTSAPFPIARSEWDMKQNAYFCPDCQHDYTLATNKYPNHGLPHPNCSGGCNPSCCRACNGYAPRKPMVHPNPCFPPHPAVVPHPHVVPPSHPVVPHPHVPPSHPVVPHPVVPHNPVSPPHVTPVPKVNPAATSSFFFF